MSRIRLRAFLNRYDRRAEVAYDGDWRWMALQHALALAPVMAGIAAAVVLATGIDWAWTWLAALFALPLGIVSLLPGMLRVSVRRRRARRHRSLRR